MRDQEWTRLRVPLTGWRYNPSSEEDWPMEHASIAIVVLASLAFKGAAIFVLAYAGARLAIRHERRSQESHRFA